MKHNKRYYLGLDLATIQTGWAIAVIQDRQMVQLMKGAISLDASKALPIRLRELRTHLLYRARQFPLEPVLFKEQPVHDKYNRKISSAIFKAHGVIEVEFPTYRMVDVNPVDVKKRIARNGHASKESVQLGVRKMLNLPDDFSFLNFDESDAVAILLTGLLNERLIEAPYLKVKNNFVRTSVRGTSTFTSYQ